MATIYHPPSSLDTLPAQSTSLFLAGSIEMGRAEDWQTQVCEAFQSLPELVIFNPRRPDWDSSWSQRADFAPFREQVEWELDALERATCVLMYLAPGTHSPISLLELGLFVRQRKLIVACPDGFWRQGNVEIVCARYGAQFVASLDEGIKQARLACEARLG